jgi:uncharacterized protein YdaT
VVFLEIDKFPMHFTNQNSPGSFKFLRPEIKNKAIEIANSLIGAGFEEDIIEVVALSNAKLWACYSLNEPMGLKKNIPVHLVPHPKGWALISEDGLLVYFIQLSKNEALSKARCLAKNNKLKLYIHSLAGNINDSESFVVNTPISGPEQHLVSEGECWAIKHKGAEKPSFVFETKREAFRKAKWLAQKVHSRLVIHNQQGDIEQRFSFEI